MALSTNSPPPPLSSDSAARDDVDIAWRILCGVRVDDAGVVRKPCVIVMNDNVPRMMVAATIFYR